MNRFDISSYYIDLLLIWLDIIKKLKKYCLNNKDLDNFGLVDKSMHVMFNLLNKIIYIWYAHVCKLKLGMMLKIIYNK